MVIFGTTYLYKAEKNQHRRLFFFVWLFGFSFRTAMATFLEKRACDMMECVQEMQACAKELGARSKRGEHKEMFERATIACLRVVQLTHAMKIEFEKRHAALIAYAVRAQRAKHATILRARSMVGPPLASRTVSKNAGAATSQRKARVGKNATK